MPKSLTDKMNSLSKERQEFIQTRENELIADEMASAIVDSMITPPCRQKTIAFLAIGSEFLNGDLLESNASRSAKCLDEHGGQVKTIIISDDEHSEIARALSYLLDHHDAVLTIGGLGPTSDDKTRFAVADVLNEPLLFDSTSWQHVESRLQCFGLKITESNRQQALFPKSATIFTNHFGTANACHIQWRDHDIFMLPGPPKEYFPLFEQNIIPYLSAHQYFTSKQELRLRTLGLAEGEISEQVDTICSAYQIEPAYRWDYPYLDIKVHTHHDIDFQKLTHELTTLLKDHIVSSDGSYAEDQLKAALTNIKGKLIVGAPQAILSVLTLNDPAIEFVVLDPQHHCHVECEVQLPSPLLTQAQQVAKVNIKGIDPITKQIYHHQLSVPKREHDFDRFLNTYVAWQLAQFIQASSFSQGSND